MAIRDWFRRTGSADEREVREEIAFHLDRATQENLARGMGPEQARAEALREFGDLEKVRRDCLAARGRRPLPAIAGWAAGAGLAIACFFAGYAVRGADRAETVTVVGPTARALPLTNVQGRLLEVRWDRPRVLFATPVRSVILVRPEGEKEPEPPK